MKVLIVEDELLVAADVQQKVEQVGFVVVALTHTPDDALQALQQQNVDVVLMDIDLKSATNGIQLAQKINSTYSVPIIFLTGMSDAPIKQLAFDTHPCGFLKKPLQLHDLQSTVELAVLNHSRTKPTTEKKHFIKTDEGEISISDNDILYVKADSSYCRVQLLGQEKPLHKPSSMKEFLEWLNSPALLQIHRSHAININHIQKVNGGEVTVAGETFVIGRSYMEAFNRRRTVL